MRAPILLVLFVLHLAYATVVYEYGRDSPRSVEVDRKHGKIGCLQKVTAVKLQVPPCYELTYVLVKVENQVSVPVIKYQAETQTVWIRYNVLSVSSSTYNILAKAVRVCPYGDKVFKPAVVLGQDNPSGSNSEDLNDVFPGNPKDVQSPTYSSEIDNGNHQDFRSPLPNYSKDLYSYDVPSVVQRNPVGVQTPSYPSNADRYNGNHVDPRSPLVVPVLTKNPGVVQDPTYSNNLDRDDVSSVNPRRPVVLPVQTNSKGPYRDDVDSFVQGPWNRDPLAVV